MTSRTWQIPLRLVTGAYILSSGLDKRSLQGEAAAGMQGFAATAVPQIGDMDPDTFATALSTGETVLGAALLAPFVPSWLAGLALTGFGAGLNRLYWSAPGLRRDGDVRPTQDGIGIAKDVWLTGIGAALVLGAIGGRGAAKA